MFLYVNVVNIHFLGYVYKRSQQHNTPYIIISRSNLLIRMLTPSLSVHIQERTLHFRVFPLHECSGKTHQNSNI